LLPSNHLKHERSNYFKSHSINAPQTKPSKIVTHARGGQSYHNFDLAFDILLLIDEKGTGKFNKASWQTNVDSDGDGIHDWFEVARSCKLYG
jgi:peptidoglycan L-alanyl-D-glutamate endopeptidase CwlK